MKTNYLAIASLLIASIALAGAPMAPAATPTPASPRSLSSQRGQVSEDAALDFEALQKNFGEAQEGEKVTIEFPLTNTSDETVNILGIRPTCGCTAADDNPDSVGPGETATIKLVFNTQNRLGNQHKSATITTDDPNQQVYRIGFEGNVVTDLQFKRRIIDMGEVESGDGATEKFSLINTSGEDIEIKEIQVQDDRLTAKHVETKPYFGDEEKKKGEEEKADEEDGEDDGEEKEPKGEELIFEVSIPEDFPQANLYTNIIMKTNHEKKSQLRLPIRARVLGEFVVSPTQLVAITNPEGVMERSAIIRARHADAFEITDMNVAMNIEGQDDEEAAPAKFEIADGNASNQKKINATFTGPKQAGRYDGKLQLTALTSDGKEFPVTVPIVMVVRQARQQNMPPANPRGQQNDSGEQPAGPQPAPGNGR